LKPLGEVCEIPPGNAIIVETDYHCDEPVDIYAEDDSLTIYGGGHSLVTLKGRETPE
jgi:hypothetical protein